MATMKMDKVEQRARELLAAECGVPPDSFDHPLPTATVDEATALRAIAAALRAQAGAVPEGWKLVPNRATDAMAKAGGNAIASTDDSMNWTYAGDALAAWAAMLVAAPSPPVEQAAGVLEISHEDLCRLSRVFNANNTPGLWQDQRINKWLGDRIAAALAEAAKSGGTVVSPAAGDHWRGG